MPASTEEVMLKKDEEELTLQLLKATPHYTYGMARQIALTVIELGWRKQK